MKKVFIFAMYSTTFLAGFNAYSTGWKKMGIALFGAALLWGVLFVVVAAYRPKHD